MARTGPFLSIVWVPVTCVPFLDTCLYRMRNDRETAPSALSCLLSQHTSPVAAQWVTHIPKLLQDDLSLDDLSMSRGEATVLKYKVRSSDVPI